MVKTIKTIKVYNVSPKIMGYGKPPVTLRLGVAEVDRAGFVRALTPKNTALRKMIAIGGLRLDTGEHVLEVRKPRKTPITAYGRGNIKSGERPERRTVRPLHGTQMPCALMLALLEEIDAGPAPVVPAPPVSVSAAPMAALVFAPVVAPPAPEVAPPAPVAAPSAPEVSAPVAPPVPSAPAPVAAPPAPEVSAPVAPPVPSAPDVELREALTKLGFKPRKNARRDTLEAKYLDLSGVHWPNGTPALSPEGAPE